MNLSLKILLLTLKSTYRLT